MKIILLVIALLIPSAPSMAGSGKVYNILVTREESNFYKINGSDAVIKTKYCYEYSYNQKALLMWNGKHAYDNKLIFLDYNNKPSGDCQVDKIFVEAGDF